MRRGVDARGYSDSREYRAALKRKFEKTEKQRRQEYESKVETTYVQTRYSKVIRNASIIMLLIFLGMLGAFFGKNLYDDYKSRSNVESLQTFVASGGEADAETAPEAVTETEILKQEIPAEELPLFAAEDPNSLPLLSTASPLPEELQERYLLLAAENPDFCGWLTIPDTEVNYPVMYRENDNDFYLKHNFYGEEDVNGLLVLDKRCDPAGEGQNILIHGHNMRSGFMFGSLKRYKEPAYRDKHPLIRYDTLHGTRSYEVFAVFLSSVDPESTEDFHYYDYIEINNREDFDAYVNMARQESLYQTDVPVDYGDQLITLSTCDYTKDNGRLVVLGKEVAQ